MQEKIKEVQNYFKNKLLTQDFIMTKISEHTLELEIDHQYQFTIWIGNWDYKGTVKLYENDCNFMYFNLNQKERLKLHEILNKNVLNYKNNILNSEKLKKFNLLKKELNIK